MAYEYERAFGLAGNGEPTQAARSQMIDIEVGEQRQVNPAVAVGVLGLLGGLALIAIVAPFGIGALAAAAAAPEGRKKKAAKWGALAGGLSGWVAYPIFRGLTGSPSVARSMGSLAPIAVGAWMGLREKESLEQERAVSS